MGLFYDSVRYLGHLLLRLSEAYHQLARERFRLGCPLLDSLALDRSGPCTGDNFAGDDFLRTVSIWARTPRALLQNGGLWPFAGLDCCSCNVVFFSVGQSCRLWRSIPSCLLVSFVGHRVWPLADCVLAGLGQAQCFIDLGADHHHVARSAGPCGERRE